MQGQSYCFLVLMCDAQSESGATSGTTGSAAALDALAVLDGTSASSSNFGFFEAGSPAPPPSPPPSPPLAAAMPPPSPPRSLGAGVGDDAAFGSTSLQTKPLEVMHAWALKSESFRTSNTNDRHTSKATIIDWIKTLLYPLPITPPEPTQSQLNHSPSATHPCSSSRSRRRTSQCCRTSPRYPADEHAGTR